MSECVIDAVPNLILGRKRDGRCVYDRQAKRELVKRCEQPGVSVAAMALAQGLSANLLCKWITVASTRRVSGASVALILLPVTTMEPTAAPRPSDGHLEVVFPGGTIRIRGYVSRDALQVVIDCLSRWP